MDRVRQTRRLLRSEGYSGVAARVANRVSNRISPPGSGRFPIARADLERAAEIAANGWTLPAPLEAMPGEPLTIAWVCAPPGPGSGGHTTMFRLISALEQAGHRCILYLQDEHGWALEQHEKVIRSWWPWVKAEVRDLAAGIEDAHAIFATAWETAYPVLASPARGTRFYLVQDFEPSFYPAGSEWLLAEATYRFGFHHVTAGRWLSELLAARLRRARRPLRLRPRSDVRARPRGRPRAAHGRVLLLAPADAPPGPPARRDGARPVRQAPSRGRHPRLRLGCQGDCRSRPPTTVSARQEQLNAMYNRSLAGLVLSATNVSLVPHEMLAAGCIPVVNDAEQNRIVLDNSHVAYAPATPFELAAKLCELVERPVAERQRVAEAAAASVQGTSWDDAGATVVRIVERVVGGAPRDPRLLRADR